MSLQCPRCTFIASLRAVRPRAPRHKPLLHPTANPTIRTRTLTTTLPLRRNSQDKKLWDAERARRRSVHESNLQNVVEKLRRGNQTLNPDEFSYIIPARRLLQEQGIKIEKFNKSYGGAGGEAVVKFADGSSIPAFEGQRDKRGQRQLPDSSSPEKTDYSRNIGRDLAGRYPSSHRSSESALQPASRQTKLRSTREKLNAEWIKREADHAAAFKPGLNVERVMEKLIENVTWQTNSAEEVSAAQQGFDNGVDERFDIDPENFASRRNDITPGSLVEVNVSAHSIPYLAIHLKSETGNYSRDVFVLTPQGSLQSTKADHNNFTIPDFVERSQIDELLKRIQETGRIPSDVVQPITKQLREFRARCQKEYPAISARIERLHSTLSDPLRPKKLTTVEIARMVTETDTPADEDVYATHLALLKKRELFTPVEGLQEKVWEVNPLSQVDRAGWLETIIRESVSDGKSEGGKIIKAFASKARKIIDFSRKARKAEKGIGKMSEKLDVVWDTHDLAILKGLEESFSYTRGQSAILKPLYPHILNIVDRYGKDTLLDEQRLFDFLGEVGVCSPWEDTVLREARLGLSGHRTNEQAEEDGKRYQAVESGEVTWEDLGLVDKMRHLRYDWKDLAVYCIDSAGTKDVDDGISIERIPDSDDLWLRVHIANPTAFLPMDHWISEIARRKVSTFYGPQRNYPMIPLKLSVEHLGLAPNRPVMTISMRVDEKTGETKEYDIRSAMVHNVKRVTYDQLNEEFLKEVPKPLVLSNKPEVKPTEKVPQPERLSPQERDVLKVFYDLAWKMRAQRMKSGAFETSVGSELNIEVDNGHGNKIHPGLSEDPVLDVHEPTITLTLLRRHKTKETFMWPDVVREAMTLAGRAVAKWSAERGLMQIYRGHNFVWDNEEEEQKWYAVMKKAEDEHKYTPEEFWTIYFPVGAAQIGPDVKRHSGLGFDGYVKATSPLRRYGDFVSHHIIESQLLAEAQAKGGKVATSQLFSKEELEALCENISEKEKMYKSAEKAVLRLWGARLLKQLWAKNDPRISRDMEIEIISVAKHPSPASAEIRGWDMSGVRVYFPAGVHKNVKYGDIVKARLADWHWSTSSNNTQVLTMDYKEYVETMEERQTKFWEKLRKKERAVE
ncbi:hypothetical protein ABW20_dc0108687 [Dactylellina cionopaga]|nr:hypothetical protein ABW20_dc0108687 [Dactylellina cionopaga]